MNKLNKKESNLTKFLKAPVRLLVKARNAYERALMSCSAKLCYVGGAAAASGFVLHTGNVHVSTTAAMPRSFSVNSTGRWNNGSRDEDFRELVTAASLRETRGSLPGTTITAVVRPPPLRRPLVLKRNYTTGIGRVDKEKPSDFGEKRLFSRSKSYSVRGKNTGRGVLKYRRLYNKNK